MGKNKHKNLSNCEDINTEDTETSVMRPSKPSWLLKYARVATVQLILKMGFLLTVGRVKLHVNLWWKDFLWILHCKRMFISVFKNCKVAKSWYSWKSIFLSVGSTGLIQWWTGEISHEGYVSCYTQSNDFCWSAYSFPLGGVFLTFRNYKPSGKFSTAL